MDSLFQVLLATIYVAIEVPFKASFPDNFRCIVYDSLSNGSLTMSTLIHNGTLLSTSTTTTTTMTNESDGVDMSTKLFDENNVENDGIYEEDDNQKKSYLALNVFVETIFIVGEFISVSVHGKMF
jgi:hypothetical protein